MAGQLELLDDDRSAPDGFRYQADLLTPEHEADLLGRIEGLAFREFEFHGYVGKRRVISFGWKYDFAKRRIEEAPAVPDFLLPVRDLAAVFGRIPAETLEQMLVTEYQPGSAIGWHRDKPNFGDVIGVSLAGACQLRFRRRTGSTWQRYTRTVAPRSAYLLQGAARAEWEHSIPAVSALRYSVTFRTLRARPP